MQQGGLASGVNGQQRDQFPCTLSDLVGRLGRVVEGQQIEQTLKIITFLLLVAIAESIVEPFDFTQRATFGKSFFTGHFRRCFNRGTPLCNVKDVLIRNKAVVGSLKHHKKQRRNQRRNQKVSAWYDDDTHEQKCHHLPLPPSTTSHHLPPPPTTSHLPLIE